MAIAYMEYAATTRLHMGFYAGNNAWWVVSGQMNYANLGMW